MHVHNRNGEELMTNRALVGVLPVVQTPFSADGSLDIPALMVELNWVLDQGASGLTTGMVSEVLRLTESERQQLAEAVCEVANDRGRLSIISCGAESTRTAVSYAQHAERSGASAVMAIPPISVVLSDSATFDYFLAIGDSISISLVVQDASGYVGLPLSIDVQVSLLEHFGARIYFKPEATPIGPRLSLLRDATGGVARVFEGSGGAALVDSYRRGIVGTMPGADVCWAIQRMWNSLEAGDWSTAYSISGSLGSLIRLQSSLDSYVAIEKYLLVKQGVIPSAASRGPQGFVLDYETENEIDRLFDVLLKSSL